MATTSRPLLFINSPYKFDQWTGDPEAASGQERIFGQNRGTLVWASG